VQELLAAPLRLVLVVTVQTVVLLVSPLSVVVAALAFAHHLALLLLWLPLVVLVAAGRTRRRVQPVLPVRVLPVAQGSTAPTQTGRVVAAVAHRKSVWTVQPDRLVVTVVTVQHRPSPEVQ
jgi:hypothetical protein